MKILPTAVILYRIRNNFWLVPSATLLAAILLGTAAPALDRLMDAWAGKDFILLYGGDPQGAESILSIIAGSMITIASITFSITVLTLTLAISNLGPRLLDNFMRDRSNQFSLGFFVSTFVYCLLVIQNISRQGAAPPRFSVSLAVLLALAGFFVLVYFIHHVASSIKSDVVIYNVEKDLISAIDRIYEKAADETEEPDGDREPDPWPDPARPIHAPRSGYVQQVPRRELLETAVRLDLRVDLEVRPGDFVVRDGLLGHFHPRAEARTEGAEKELAALVAIGKQRTPTQDMEFAINQMVEIALRALSPGINDTFTALTCTDRLGAALALIIRRRIPSGLHRDDKGVLRLRVKEDTFAGMLDAAFNPVRQVAKGNVPVLARLLEALGAVASFARRPADVLALERHAQMVARSAENHLDEENDRRDVLERYRAVRDVLEKR